MDSRCSHALARVDCEKQIGCSNVFYHPFHQITQRKRRPWILFVNRVAFPFSIAPRDKEIDLLLMELQSWRTLRQRREKTVEKDRPVNLLISRPDEELTTLIPPQSCGLGRPLIAALMRRAALSSPFLCRVIIPASSFQTHYFYHTTSCTTSGGSSDSGPYQIWLGFAAHNELVHRPLSFCCGSTQNSMFILHLLTLMSCKIHTTFFVPWKATGNMHPGFLDHSLSPGHALCLLVQRGRPE